ncbi:MAG: hypothetical protein K6G39_05345 [Bacteroidales bacterium]|nr:hypothetical protein [Bacteroidales bacterium]
MTSPIKTIVTVSTVVSGTGTGGMATRCSCEKQGRENAKKAAVRTAA